MSDHTTEEGNDFRFGIEHVSAQTGVPVWTLRIWEKRYHWPSPVRNSSGYLLYSESQIADIRRMGDLIAKGQKIGTLVQDGKPVWPSTLVPKPERPMFDFSDIPQPSNPSAKWVRGQLETSLANNDEGGIEWAKNQGLTFRPIDRERAVLALLARAGKLPPGETAPATTKAAPEPEEITPESLSLPADPQLSVLSEERPPAEEPQAPIAAEVESHTTKTEKHVAKADSPVVPAPEIPVVTVEKSAVGKKKKAKTIVPGPDQTPPTMDIPEVPAEASAGQSPDIEAAPKRLTKAQTKTLAKSEGNALARDKKPVKAKTKAPASPAIDLVAAIKTRIKEADLSIAIAARQMDVAPVSLSNLLTKGSKPNSRTRGRLEAWLKAEIQVPAQEVKADETGKTAQKTKPKANIATSAPKAAGKAAQAEKAPKAKVAREPRKPRLKSPSLLKALAVIQEALDGAGEAVEVEAAPAHPILGDKLAIKVHGAPKKIREGINALLGMAGI